MSTLTRLTEFREKLTSLPSKGSGAGEQHFRVVHSSGGAAGAKSITSEGMGYGLLIAGVAVASQPESSAGWRAALTFGEELFAGWRRMCELSTGTCQDDPHQWCGGRLKRDGPGAKGFASCLPSWLFDDALRAQAASGSAADGDEDALLGLVLLTQSTSPKLWPLHEQTLAWTYESLRAFLRYDTSLRTDARGRRVPRLGSCWGGFDCNNPSYVAPGHYRAFRSFMLRHGPSLGVSEAQAEMESKKWDALIEGAYALLDDAQCDSTGLVPNWWQPSGPDRTVGQPGCNASGTAAAEFGAEAARATWRVVLDALWSGSAEASKYAARVTRQLASRHDETAPDFAGFRGLEVDPRCPAVQSVHPDWYWNAFIYGPLSTALLLPLPASSSNAERHKQQQALDLLAERAAAAPLASYYAGAWLSITTLTLNGDLSRACSKVFDGELGGVSTCPGDKRLVPASFAKRKDSHRRAGADIED